MCLSANDPGGPRRCSTHAYNRLRSAEVAHADAEGALRIAEGVQAALTEAGSARDASADIARAQQQVRRTAEAAEAARDDYYATPEGVGVAAADLDRILAHTEWQIRQGRRTDQIDDPLRTPEVRTAMRRLAAAEQQLAGEDAERRDRRAQTGKKRWRRTPALAPEQTPPVRRGARPGSGMARAFGVTGVYSTDASGRTTMTLSRRRDRGTRLDKVKVPVSTPAPTVADGIDAAGTALRQNPDSDLSRKLSRFFDKHERWQIADTTTPFRPGATAHDSSADAQNRAS